MPINESDFWNEEVFKINFVLVSFDSLNSQQSKMKVYLSCDGDFSNTFDIEAKDYGGKVKLKFVQFEANIRPLLTMIVKLPDHRTKNQMKNLVQMLVDEMVEFFEAVKPFANVSFLESKHQKLPEFSSSISRQRRLSVEMLENIFSRSQ